MNTATALDLITARQTTLATAADQIRAQITALTGELTRLEGELADLDTTRKTLLHLSAEQTATADPTILSEPYQQILAVLGDATGPLRAKDVCLALGLDTTPKHTESLRARLKRLVRRDILTETPPGQFTLKPATAAPDQRSNP